MATYTIQLEGCYSGNCVRLNELELYNKIGKINYTIVDAFDSRVGAVPYYWNQGTLFGKEGLNDGNKTYSAATSTAFLYSTSASTVTPSDGHFVRISVTCTEAPTIVVLNFTGRDSTLGGVAKYVTLFQDGVLATKDSGTVILSKKTIVNEYTEQTFTSYTKKFLISSEGNYYSIKSGTPVVYSADVTATMTSNTTPTGYVVSTNSDLNNGNYVAWKAFDDSESYGWLTSSNILTGYLRIKIPSPKIIKAYRVSSADNLLLTNASEWAFEASNDGIVWTILDTVKGSPFLSKKESRTYSFNNELAYQYYQFNCTKNSGHATQIGLGEIELFEEVTKSVPTTLIYLESITENTFLDLGLSNKFEIELNKQMLIRGYLKTSSEHIGSGRVFKRSIDTTNVPIKKVTIT